jgi:hypothetical protein
LYERYNGYVKLLAQCENAKKDSLQRQQGYDKIKLEEEYKQINFVKREGEKKINEEIKIFEDNYRDEYSKIVEEYYQITKGMNNTEFGIMQVYTKDLDIPKNN